MKKNKISCIYIIKNKVNNDFYLGSSRDYIKRIRVHFRNLIKKKHHSIKLQRAWDRYGKENFEFLIYQWCNENELLELENYYLKLHDPKYNVSKDSCAPMLGRKHGPYIRELMSKIHKGNKYNLGRKTSVETKLLMSKIRTGTKRNLVTRQKMSDTAIRINAIGRVDREKNKKKIVDNFGNTYNSLTDCSKIIGASVQAVCDNLKNRSFYVKKIYKLRYHENA